MNKNILPSSSFQGLCRSHPALAGIAALDLQKIIDNGRAIAVKRGQVIWAEGAVQERFYLVLSGWVGFFKNNSEGKEVVTHIATSGSCLPDCDEIVAHTGARTTVQALSELQLFEVSLTFMREAMGRIPALTTNILHLMAEQHRVMRARIEGLLLLPAEDRVRRFLLELRLTASSERAEIELPFEKATMAAYLGIKPETLSRILAKLREEGFSTGRHAIVMAHECALCAVCDMDTAALCVHAESRNCPNPSVSGNSKASHRATTR